MIRRYTIWRNNPRLRQRLRRIIDRANVTRWALALHLTLLILIRLARPAGNATSASGRRPPAPCRSALSAAGARSPRGTFAACGPIREHVTRGQAQAPSFRAGLARPVLLFDVLPEDRWRRTATGGSEVRRHQKCPCIEYLFTRLVNSARRRRADTALSELTRAEIAILGG